MLNRNTESSNVPLNIPAHASNMDEADSGQTSREHRIAELAAQVRKCCDKTVEDILDTAKSVARAETELERSFDDDAIKEFREATGLCPSDFSKYGKVAEREEFLRGNSARLPASLRVMYAICKLPVPEQEPFIESQSLRNMKVEEIEKEASRLAPRSRIRIPPDSYLFAKMYLSRQLPGSEHAALLERLRPSVNEFFHGQDPKLEVTLEIASKDALRKGKAQYDRLTAEVKQLYRQLSPRRHPKTRKPISRKLEFVMQYGIGYEECIDTGRVHVPLEKLGRLTWETDEDREMYHLYTSIVVARAIGRARLSKPSSR